MVPTFALFRWLGWVGTFRPLWVPAYFAGAFSIFLLRQFYRTIPMELSEAAKIDGASELRTFLQVIVPLARPALAVVALFTFMGSWNDFMGPLIYLVDQNTFTLSLGLQAYQTTHGGTPWNLLMAASTLVILPIVVVFFVAQKVFIQGIATSGLK
jgi:multiple sugar transport system permease protein